MPKPIRLTKSYIQQMLAEFTQTLSELKLSDGKVSYVKTLAYEDKDEEGVTVLFEPVAYAKMLMLINTFSDEVAWHGTVERLEEKVFVIKDIFVYPQMITGGTVTTDQERYQTWMMELDDDTFNALHMQGHSHVSFGTTPSAVDNKFYDSILDQLGDEDYYIFMIFNKRLERTVKVYDMRSNTMYENADVSIGIRCEGGDLEQFIADAKDDAVKSTTVYTTNGYKANQPATNYAAKTPVSSNNKKEEKKTGGANKGAKRVNDKQYPTYYGGRGVYDETGIVDYDAEIFGKRQDWWNE